MGFKVLPFEPGDEDYRRLLLSLVLKNGPLINLLVQMSYLTMIPLMKL